ncbi:MAG TPA: CopD family protein [Gemmatimonadales bacterium]|nr:CopD family protein [Gemmatimonadales bacterium]
MNPAAVGSGATQFLTYIGSAAVIGAACLAGAVLTRYRNQAWHQATLHRTIMVGLAGASLLLLAHVTRLLAQAYATFGVDEPLRFDHVVTVIRQTAWGRGWVVQVAMAVGAVAVLARCRRTGRLSSTLAGMLALSIAVSLPLTGHAAAQTARPVLSIGLQAIHVVAGAGWVGTLLVLWVVCLGALASPADGHDSLVAAMVRVFTPLALTGAAVAVVAGVLISFSYFDAVPQLWTTPYGRTLVLKVSLVAGTAGVGAYNWKRVQPNLGSPGWTEKLRRSVTGELVFAGLLLATTAVLVGMPFPGE